MNADSELLESLSTFVRELDQYSAMESGSGWPPDPLNTGHPLCDIGRKLVDLIPDSAPRNGGSRNFPNEGGKLWNRLLRESRKPQPDEEILATTAIKLAAWARRHYAAFGVTPSVRDEVFISYSHQDERFRKELEEHLKPYLRNGSIRAWTDRQIVPGSRWFDEIKQGLSRAKVAVLLVSPAFLASDFIHQHELGPLLKAAEEEGVRLLWVPVRASSYHQSPISELQAMCDPLKPLAGMRKPERDIAWVSICEAIQRAVRE